MTFERNDIMHERYSTTSFKDNDIGFQGETTILFTRWLRFQGEGSIAKLRASIECEGKSAIALSEEISDFKKIVLLLL